MWFQFTSDDIETLTGFSLTYTASDEPLATTPPMSTVPPTKPYATPNPVLGLELMCDATSMTVVFNKDALFPSVPDPSEVTLTNTSCVGYAYGNGTSLIAVTTDYNECGTTMEETNDHVVYRNRVIYGIDPENPQLDGGLECRLARHLQADAVSSPLADNVQFTQVGYGNFTFDMDFYPDSGYGAPYGPDDFPLQAEVGADVFVEARVATNTNLDLLIDACWATDSSDPDDTDMRFLISSGCAKDDSVVYYSAPLSSQRFSFATFIFPDGDPTIYLHCQLLTCDAAIPDTRCKEGCLSRKRRSIQDYELELHTVSSSGPISMRRS
ncbi:ZP domain-containing protein-like [Amphiura filiformis]